MIKSAKKKLIMLLVASLALTSITVPIHAAVWDTTRVYTGTADFYDVAIGNKFKGVSDDTVRIFAAQSATPYNVLLFTDISTTLPMNWRTDIIRVENRAMRGVAIGDPDRDGDNDLLYGRSATPYRLKRAFWTGSAWATDTIGPSTAYAYPGPIYDIAIGDADNDGNKDDIIVATGTGYHIFRVRWTGTAWDTTRIFNGSSTTGSMYGVAIGDFDTTYPGNEVVGVTYSQRVYRIRWTGTTWDATLIYLAPIAERFYDVAVGDFDADNPGNEIVLNNAGLPNQAGAVIELYGSSDNWTAKALYTPASWATDGEIAVGDFFAYHPGAEIAAVAGSQARLMYGSGDSWYSESIPSLGTNTRGIAIGDINRYHSKDPISELAIGSAKCIFEAEERRMNDNMATMSINSPATGVGLEGNGLISINVTVKNVAPDSQSNVPVHLLITDGAGYVYSDTEYTGTISEEQTAPVTFTPNWTVPNTHARYTIKAWTALVGDEYALDDTVSISVFGYPQGYAIEGFENPTFPPEDWTEIHTAGTGWIRASGYPHSGTYSAQNSVSSGSHWLITPKLEISRADDQLRYWIRKYYYTHADWFFVKVSTGSLDTSAFVPVDSIVTENITESYVEKTVNLGGYLGEKGKGQVYVAFVMYQKGTQVLIDDVLLPPKYVPPADIALLSIDDLSSFIGNGTSVEVKVTVQNQAEDTLPAGVPIKLRIDGPAGYVYGDSDQTTLMDLPPGGTEQITFSPDWLVPDVLDYFTVTVWSELSGDPFPANDTLSKQILVYRAGGLLETFTNTSFPPTSWTVYNFDGSDIWARNTSYYHSPPACARVYYDTPNNDWLITPRLRVQNGDNLRYWWKAQSSAYIESLYVRVSTNPNVADTGYYTAIDMVSGNSGIFTERLIDLSSYAGQMIYIAFHYPVNRKMAVCIDDITGPYFPTQIALNPDNMEVEAFPDTNFDRILNVGNVGGGVLNYNIAIAQSSPWLSVYPTSGSAATGEEDPITLTFHTTGLDGHYYDTLMITSNSGEKENPDTALVPVHLWVRLIPQITVSPDSFAVELEGNSSINTSMFIGNPGYGTLDYSIWTEEWTSEKVMYSGEPANREHGQNFKSLLPPGEDKNFPEYQFGEPPDTGHGGPDAFGYRWIDSDELGGPVFNWIEINETGTVVDVTNDGNVGPFAIGFPFKFYGNEFTQFRVASDGFISFTSTTGTSANVPIPRAAEPNNLLALFWDDLVSASGSGLGYIYYHSDSNRLVVEWDQVKRSGCDTCRYTMEMVLYPNGKIVYQYKHMTGHRLNEATVGIENGSGTTGLEVVYNAPYVRDSLALAFWPAPAWLSFNPESGTVPVDETDTVDVSFNSIGILDGDFFGAFIILNNDPYKPIDTIPAHMKILAPQMSFSPDSTVTSGTEGGTPFNLSLSVGNSGQGKLLYHIVENVPWLSVSPSADTVDVGAPASAVTLTIDCTSLYAGIYLGQLKVYSNDPDLQPYAIYQVRLHVGPDPDVNLSPDSFHVSIFNGLSKDTTLTISNGGDGHLVWDMEIEDLKATETRETILTEGFESSFPPSGWSVSGSCTPGAATPCQWHQDCSGLYVHSGSCSALSGWGYSMDVWLKTPSLTLGVGPYLKFWWYSSWAWHVYPHDNGDLFVQISTDGGASWNTLWTFGDSSMVVNSGGPWPWVNWTWYEATLELPEIFGDAIIAFHVVADDNADISIDDVEVGRLGVPWLSISSNSGVINPHSSTDVTVSFSSVGVTQDKFANLHLTSNDPDEGSVQIPVHLEILDPNYSISPAETLVIDALENQYTEAYLYVRNYGGHAVLSYQMTETASWLSEIPDASDVPIDGEDTVIVKLDGYQLIAGDYQTELLISTNDFDLLYDTVLVIVHLGPPPEISILPESLQVVVPASFAANATLTINNDGDGHLGFRIATNQTGFILGARLEQDRVNEMLKNSQTIPAFEDTRPVNESDPSNVTVLGSAGPMLASSAGGSVKASGDTVFVQIPHDPSDPWSHATSDQGAGYKVYENFWDLTLPVSSLQWWGQCLIYTGSGWADGNPNNLVFDITFYSDPPNDPSLPPTQVACTYQNVLPSVVIPTGQLYNNRPMFLFGGVELDPYCNLTEGWVSIQSKSAGQGFDWFLWASAKTGDGFSYQQGSSPPEKAYDRAVLMTGSPTWLTVSPQADTLNPHSGTNVNVRLDAAGILGGDKYGSLIVSSNDPDENPITVPVHMIIASANYSVDPAELHVNALENHVTPASLTISNPGGPGILGFKLSWTVPWLTVIPDTSEVPPDGSENIMVRIDGNQLIAGDYYTEIMAITNSFDHQLDTIPVFIHVGPDPDIDLAVSTLKVPILPGCFKQVPLRVNNSGNGHLSFQTSIETGGPDFAAVSSKKQKQLDRAFGRDKQSQTILPPAGTPISRNGNLAPDVTPKTTPSLSGTGFNKNTGYIKGDVEISEGFEGAWLPDGWTMIQNNYGTQSGHPCYWAQTTYSVHSGTYSAQVWWSSYYQDEWLITPSFTFARICTLSFWTYGYQGSTYGDHYYVKVTTDDGANWTPLFDLSALSGGWNYFATPYYIDLSAYAGMNIRLAWHAEDPESNDGLWYAWMIDDILVQSYLPVCFYTVSPEADTLNPGSYEDLILNFDPILFETCSEETLTCNLIFSTNDPDEPTVTLPVSAWSGRGDIFTPSCLTDIGDVIFLVNYILKGGPAPNPICLGDMALPHDSMVDMSDLIYLVQYLFNAGTPPLVLPQTISAPIQR